MIQLILSIFYGIGTILYRDVPMHDTAHFTNMCDNRNILLHASASLSACIDIALATFANNHITQHYSKYVVTVL